MKQRADWLPARISPPALLAKALVWLIVAACCLLPLGWIIFQIVANPTTLREMHVDAWREALLGRTVLYGTAVGVIATLLALPAAWMIGRGRGWGVLLLGFLLPISLLIPSLVIAYGWKQLVRITGLEFELAGFWDVMRCIWSLATWLWPAPAMVIGLSLRRTDPQVQQQALLDGVLVRTMLRQLAGPIIASICIVSLLSMQEYSVYEPTGISVVATEVRMVFETGAYSSPTNPITQPLSVSGTIAQDEPGFLPDQRARAAAAVATAMPLLGVLTILSIIAWLSVRRLSAAEQLETGTWPASLNAPLAAGIIAALVVAIALGVPIASLIASLHRRFDVIRIWDEFAPQLTGTLIIAVATGLLAILLALAAVPSRSRWTMVAAVISFLIGGQILAIAMIRLYNHPQLDWVYNGMPVVMMTYIGRFGWIVIAAAGLTWSKPWRQIRDLAAIDGASPIQTAQYVIWPLAWPILGASAMFVLILSLSEVPATVLISPQRPQMLVPMLMTWVHMLRYDAMIEASLLAAAVVVVLGAAALAMAWMGARYWRVAPVVLLSMLPFIGSCRNNASPHAIWLSTGTGPAQVVYPRGIAYSSSDDSFYVVDREARIQHLDDHGQFIADWRMPKWEQGKPVGITVGPDGDIYIPDTHYHRVMVYSPTGELKRQWGSRGTGNGQFIYPTDIAFDASGHVFVAEYGDNDRIQVFDTAGNYLYQFGRFGENPGELSRPQSMVIDGETLYVTDACNHRISVFKTDGTFLRTMGQTGSELGQFRFPYGLDQDSAGHLVVCEFGNNRVQLIDKQTGKGIATWGLAGREPGELAYPWGVAVDKHGRVVAVDAGNNRLQVFEF
jgi:DNA-binding beta-propeller fold protein YncE/ABC-type Fe3+ transport system permease subunit